jgi:hypothetical protein
VRFLKRPALLCAVLALSAALAVGACGSSSNPATVGTTHAVVGFAAHAGLAFGAFKLFVYDPYKAGKLKLRHPFTLAKAAAGALFAYHEVKKALAELHGHPKLAALVGPLTLLAGTLHVLTGGLKHGSTGGVSGAQSTISSVGSKASSLGSPISTITSGLHL